ncbi:hypothetical protein IWQ62_006696, partial [Dispira parvispora]
QQAIISRYVGRSWGGAIIVAGIGWGLAQIFGGPKKISTHREITDNSDAKDSKPMSTSSSSADAST